MQTRLILTGLLTGTAALLPATQAFAQAESVTEANEIVVTANKREQKLIDVGSSLTAISGADLSYRNLVRIEDFAAQVPGFNLQSFGPRAVRLILRGLNSGNSSAVVGVVIDETPFSYQSGLATGAVDTANLDTFDMARIEVLKGPQGTLYGATAEGGLLKYVTNKPDTKKVEAAVELGAEAVRQGNLGPIAKGMINLPFWDGKAAIRASGFYQRVPGYADNVLLGRTNSNKGKRWGGRISLLVEPVETLSIRLTGSRQDQSFGDDGSVELVGANLTPQNQPANRFDVANGGRFQRNNYIGNPSRNYYQYANLLINYDAGFADLVSSTSYGRLSSAGRSDATFGNSEPGVTNSDDFSPIYGESIAIVQRQTTAVDRWNQEFRIASKPGSQLFGIGFDWQFGAFYASESLTFRQFFDAISLATRTVLTDPARLGGNILPGSYREYAGFGDVTVHLTDRFDVSAGGRYSHNRQRSQVISPASLFNGPDDIINDPLRSRDSKLTWSFSTRWRFNDASLLYGRVASGYRAGGPQFPIPGATADVPLTYKPDSTVNYEAGLRTSFWGGKINIDVAAFLIDWTDIQIISTFLSPVTGSEFVLTGNAGRARSKGIEWGAAIEPLRGLTISVAGSYTDAKLTRDAPLLGGAAGERLAFVPKWSNTLNVDYEHVLADDMTAFAGGSWIYAGNRFDDFSVTDGTYPARYRLPGYSQFNAQAGINFGRFSVSAYVRNLTDKRALTSYSPGNGYNLTGVGGIITPRTVGVKLTATY